MNLARVVVVVVAALILSVVAGCDSLPGKPKESDLPLSPTQVKTFAALYGQNCAGCHGASGELGAAYPIANPVYQALVDDATMTRIISLGVAGTPMSPFRQGEGGYLTAEQVKILVNGMRQRWKTGAPLANVPPYAAAGAGDPQRGAQVFAQSCAPCHGADGSGGPKAASITNPSYLVLVSDQALRTVVIAGRPDLGHPNWRGYPPGQPLTAQQVSDVVAWLAAKRPQFAPGSTANSMTGDHSHE
jgi:cytochrome c oxidase cbb3-type subunit III